MHLSIRYWKFHHGYTIALLSAIIISTMSMTIGIFLARSASQTNVEEKLDVCGNYDIVVQNIEKEQLNLLSEDQDIAKWGVILNGGTCQTDSSDALYFGAMDSKQAEILFHYQPEKEGRYPEAVGEICGYKSSFEALGTAAVLGNQFELELYDIEGKSIGIKRFTIVGVLNDQKGAYSNVMRKMEFLGGNQDGVDFPEMFVYKDELPDKRTMSAMILCSSDQNQYMVSDSLRAKGIETLDGTRLSELASIAVVDYETEDDLYQKAHLAYNDFYSSYIIPAFLGIVLIVSFISVYGVMSRAMLEREKQLGLLRSIGMSRRGVRKLLFGEAAAFCLAGVAIGYGVGTLIYAVYVKMVNELGDVYIYSAFNAHPIAKAVSLNPYLFPWILGILFSLAAAVIPLLKEINLSPNEMLFPEKAAKTYHNQRKLNNNRIVSKITGKKLSRDIGVIIVILITGWTFVFGAVFMLAKSDNDSAFAKEQLNEVSLMDADYSVSKDIYDTMLANVQFNRHQEGISPEDMTKLQSSEDVAEVRGVIKLPGLKLLYKKDEIANDIEKALEELDISNNIKDFLRELDEKSRAAQGYETDDLLYRLPSVAVDSDILDNLDGYEISGKMDKKGMEDGSKVVIVEYSGKESQNPYVAGDKLTLTDTVILDEYIETYDFSTNEMPKGYKATFKYDYLDGSVTDLPGYSFGKKIQFDVQVCAVVHVDDEVLENLLYSESYVIKNNAGYVSPGYGILCSTKALPKWGLQDRCYTDVYANLKTGADTDRFEMLWYTIVGRSGRVNSISRNAIKRRIIKTELANVVLFVSMIILIIVAGCFGMVNTYSFAVKKNMKNIQIMRAIGMSKKRLIYLYIKEIVIWPLVATITSVVPIQVFDMVRKYAYHYAFDLNHNDYILAENGKMEICWQALFPWYIAMWEQPVVLVMIIAFLSLAFVNICAGIFPIRQVKKISIVEGIRNDSF
ncbi:MAG: ABC transporter permease [Lachnospiraceae bacterium]|nr:ABC transporter permease [Lachnospiraceae bacterium]